ncbi:pyroglutamyl-peptidase I [uncultured Bifidobacterium sp.]|uniref:pyroglutamyl-peptidase I n=1 Tax=uncultured Bifidobacterium sp. TaxID=165187 RepID=UPI0028DBA8E8|nr:pyroglutamyl-peptidase I [uncultured Bifidobacterium sp.]
MSRISVVVSGFDPYEGVKANPSLQVPWRLAAEGIRSDDGLDLDVHEAVLPVSFSEAWPALSSVVTRVDPVIVIATGLKRSARGIELERCATNLMEYRHADEDSGGVRREPVRSDGPAAYWTRLPLRSVLRDFSHDDIPATLSSDAGTWVCNSLFYRLLDWTHSRGRVLAGFVSLPPVPAGPDSPGLTVDRQTEALRDVVRMTVRHWLGTGEDVLVS